MSQGCIASELITRGAMKRRGTIVARGQVWICVCRHHTMIVVVIKLGRISTRISIKMKLAFSGY